MLFSHLDFCHEEGLTYPENIPHAFSLSCSACSLVCPPQFSIPKLQLHLTKDLLKQKFNTKGNLLFAYKKRATTLLFISKARPEYEIKIIYRGYFSRLKRKSPSPGSPPVPLQKCVFQPILLTALFFYLAPSPYHHLFHTMDIYRKLSAPNSDHFLSRCQAPSIRGPPTTYVPLCLAQVLAQ